MYESLSCVYTCVRSELSRTLTHACSCMSQSTVKHLEKDVLLVIITTWTNCLTLPKVATSMCCVLLEEIQTCIAACTQSAHMMNDLQFQSAIVRLVRLVLKVCVCVCCVSLQMSSSKVAHLFQRLLLLLR